MRRRKGGYTYIELLAAVFVLAVISVGILGAFINYAFLMENSINTSIALSDAQNVLERIRNIDPFTAANVTANFPSGGSVTGFNNLTSEQMVVNYTDLAADPLQITVTVSWRELGHRQRTLSLVTLMTQR